MIRSRCLKDYNAERGKLVDGLNVKWRRSSAGGTVVDNGGGRVDGNGNGDDDNNNGGDDDDDGCDCGENEGMNDDWIIVVAALMILDRSNALSRKKSRKYVHS